MLTRISALMLVLLATLALAACGGDDDAASDVDSGSSSGETAMEGSSEGSTTDADADAGEAGDGAQLQLTVDGNDLAFAPTALTAPAGSVTITLTNASSISHNIGIRDADGEKVSEEGELVSNGKTSTTTADLQPGTYTYYCAPHEGAGMVGTLTIS